MSLEKLITVFKEKSFIFSCQNTEFLRTFALLISAHPYCAPKFTRHVMHERARKVIKWTIIGQMAIAIALPGFNNLGRSMTPIFLLIDFCLLLTDHFLCQFSTFSEKNKNLWTRSSFCKLHHRIPLFLCLFICTVLNASWKVKFSENVGNVGNYILNKPSSTKYDQDHLPSRAPIFSKSG